MTRLVAACLALTLIAACGKPRSPTERSAPAATLPAARSAIEKLRLYAEQGGPYPLVALDAGRVARPRLCGFRLVIGRMLELERLEVNLPLAEAAGDNVSQPATNASAPTPSVLLRRALDLEALGRQANAATPFFGLDAHGFRLAFVRGRERVTVITATSARLSGRTLVLNDCCLLTEDLRQIETSKARLIDENGWRVTAENGLAVALDRLAAIIAPLLAAPPPSDRR
jgi:hypothetical protein